ncbi:MAG: hypothetical protein M3072_12125 [Candidatus Dormibacteraeota bacterium]|nr:hypothetical protein [Candidatus Dormibacteraeota bacterium]
MIARPAQIHRNGWAGRSSQEVLVVEETAKRYRIQAITRTRLAGRRRWLDPGQTALVPKHAVTLLEGAYELT